MKRKLIQIISLVLCGFVLCGNYATAQRTQYIDNSEGLSYNEFEQNGSMISFSKTESQSASTSAIIKTPFLIVLVRITPGFLGKVKTVLFVGTKVKIKESTQNFCLVEAKNGTTGYVFKGWLDKQDEDKEPDGEYKFNKAYDHVYVDYTNADSAGNPRSKVKNNGNETVTYSTNNTSIISVDSETGLITGKKAGTAKLIAKIGGEEISIPVYCIYKWKKAWTGKANKATTIYSGTSDSTMSVASISSGTKFYVSGDDGGSDGWAYGYATVDGNSKWGFVKINDISTKGTVSQYNSMNWRWPLKNVAYNYINSPYGTRDTTPKKHKGFDISTNWGENQSNILGQTIVSAFKGTVDYVCVNDSLSWGYCVSIVSDDTITDPVSKKQFVAIYMHMKNKPKVSRGKEVSQETELGYVGNTGNSTGPHLHFEVNNKTASIYELNGKEASDVGRSSYNDLLNPIFFYISFNPKYNKESEAEKNHNGTFWYGSE